MRMESMRQPIKTESAEEHEELLDKKLIELQIAFTAKKYSETQGEKPAFANLLRKHSMMLHTLRGLFIVSQKLEPSDEKVSQYMKTTEEKINDLAKDETPESYTAIADYMSDEFTRLRQLLPDTPKESLGLVTYHMISGSDLGLEKYGFDKNDDFFEIHLDAGYKNPEKFGIKEIKKELSQVAEKIVDEYPDSRAVVGTSWLMSHPIAKELGFKITDIKRDAGMASWSQFIDRNGQIDTKKLEKTLETGEKPFKAITGYIPVEEFLQKYLPEHRKGLVTLKMLNPEHAEIGNIEEDINNLAETFDASLEDDISIEQFFGRMPHLALLLDKLGLKENLFAILRELKSLKKTVSEARNEEKFKSQFQSIRGKIDEYIAQNKYKDKIVEIK